MMGMGVTQSLTNLSLLIRSEMVLHTVSLQNSGLETQEVKVSFKGKINGHWVAVERITAIVIGIGRKTRRRESRTLHDSDDGNSVIQSDLIPKHQTSMGLRQADQGLEETDCHRDGCALR